MKRILLSLGLIGMVATAAGGAAYAYFSSQKVLGANTIATGNLIIDLNNGDQKIANLDISDIKPGDELPDATITIKNTGKTDFGWVGKFLLAGNQDLLKQIYIKDMKMEFLKPNGTTTWEPVDHFITNGVGSGTWSTEYNRIAALDELDVISLYTWNEEYSGMIPSYPYFEGALRPEHMYKLTFKLAYHPTGTVQNGSISLGFQANATQLNQVALNSMMTSLGTPAMPDLSWMNTQIAKQNSL